MPGRPAKFHCGAENLVGTEEAQAPFWDVSIFVEAKLLLQVVSLAGASMILVAYAGIARGWFAPSNKLYALLNLVGSLLLLWVAVADRRMGFILLETLWAFVSLPPLLKSSAQPPTHA